MYGKTAPYTVVDRLKQSGHIALIKIASIGVCFEGNYEVETMPLPQFKAGQELISYLRGAYPNAEVKRHRDFMATGLSGKFPFPFNDIIKGEVVTVKKGIGIS